MSERCKVVLWTKQFHKVCSDDEPHAVSASYYKKFLFMTSVIVLTFRGSEASLSQHS